MALVAMDDRVYIIPIEPPEKIGHIYVPDPNKRQATNGIVKYRGPNCKYIRVGDHVLYGSYAGQKFAYEGEGELVILREGDIHAAFDESPSDQLFPLALIDTLLDKARGDLHVAGLADVDVERVIEKVRTYFDNYFLSNSVMF